MEPLKQTGKISPLTPIRVTEKYPEQFDSVFHLIHKFQNHLNIHELINVYIETVRSCLPFNGLRYRYPLLAANYTYGNCVNPICNYQLITEHDVWGDITIYRDTHLTKRELHQIELITSLLIHPLKMAIIQASSALSTIDGNIVGLSNPELVNQMITREGKLAIREQIPMSIVMFNVDRFRRIYDLTGHIYSDYVLYEIMQVMRNKLRDTDLLFRYFGDTFCLILKGVTARSATSISERVRNSIDQYKFKYPNKKSLHITLSAGITKLAKTDTLNSFVTRANKALSLAKQSGRNHSILADERFVA